MFCSTIAFCHPGHVDGITYVDPRGDGRHLITNSKDQSIKLWDIRQFSSRAAIETSKHAVANQRWDYRWQRVPKHVASSRARLEGDSSVMTYTGHTVLQTLIRYKLFVSKAVNHDLVYVGATSRLSSPPGKGSSTPAVRLGELLSMIFLLARLQR